MPFLTYTVDDGRGLVHLGQGNIGSEEILGLARMGPRPPEAEEKLLYVIVDLAEAVFVDVSGDHIRQLAGENEIRAHVKYDRLITIVAPGDHVFGISRMWQMLVEKLGWRIHICRRREEALSWICSRHPEARFARDQQQAG